MINEINAEMYLNHHYPELRDEWVAYCRGTFYRNYNDDALTVNPEKKTVELARDGILKLLPGGYISPENETAKEDELKRRIETLRDAFVPIDSLMLRQKLVVEQKLAGMAETKTTFVLNRIFGIDYKSVKNPMVREAALLLPYSRESRGDVRWVKRMLESITGCPVEMTLGKWSDDDNSVAWLPYVHYNVVRDGLNAKDYVRLYGQLQELGDFVADRWMSAETKLKIDLITHIQKGDSSVLDYSSHLK